MAEEVTVPVQLEGVIEEPKTKKEDAKEEDSEKKSDPLEFDF